MLSTSTLRRSALALLILATACTPPTTTDTTSHPMPKKAGETIPVTILEDGREIYRATLVLHNLETPDARKRDADGVDTDLVPLVKSEEVLDPTLAEERGGVAPSVSVEAIIAFLDEHWDEAIGGKADPGRNAEEFLELLATMRIDAATFLNEFEKLELPLGEFLKLIDFIDAYDDELGNDGFSEIVQALDNYGLTLRDFLLYVQKAGLTTAKFFEALRTNQLTFSAFLAESAEAERPLEESLKDLVNPKVQAISRTPKILNQVTQRPFIYTGHWDFIVDNQVKNQRAHVLSEEVWDPASYSRGREKRFQPRSMVVGSRNDPHVRIDWVLSFQHDVEDNTYQTRGRYLRNIDVLITKRDIGFGWTVNGRGRLGSVTYEGSADNPTAKAVANLNLAVNFLPRAWYVFRSYYYMSARKGTEASDSKEREFIWDPFQPTPWKILP